MFSFYAKSCQDTFKTYFEIIQILKSDFQQQKKKIFSSTQQRGAATLDITTFRIMTLKITRLSKTTLSTIGSSHNGTQHCNTKHCTQRYGALGITTVSIIEVNITNSV
jgi:hypothetical protein